MGGLAGCTIDGAILRCYATGNVQQGISGVGEGGIGGLAGRVDGKLPPGLGGYTGSASVQNSYYLSSATVLDPYGTPVASLLPEMARSETDMKGTTSTQPGYENWDLEFVWNWSEINYPNVYCVGIGFIPSANIQQFYYKTADPLSTENNHWSNPNNWLESTNAISYVAQGNQLSWLYPDMSNSFGIIVSSGVTIAMNEISLDVDQMVIKAGGAIEIDGGNRFSVENGIDPDEDLVNNGSITVNTNNPSNPDNPTDKALFEIGYNATFVNNGTVTMYGNLFNTGTIISGTSSGIAFAGDAKQYLRNMEDGYLQDVEINNPEGVEFLTPITIKGTLTITNGTLTGTDAPTVNAYSSPTANNLVISGDTNPISSFSASTAVTPDIFPEYVRRQWTINGYIEDPIVENREKTIHFYWTAADDGNFDWTTQEPAIFVGGATRYYREFHP
ncbi:MAG: hypothetical protein PHO85_03210 [Candidatus Cloacimonetes bacterium]|nr:hypothetical protein [Candidatus Cloacimonadota bacterium]